MMKNCGFDEGLDDWDFWVGAASGAVAAADTSSNRFTLNIESGANEEFSIGLAQAVSLKKNSNYLISFDASSTVENYTISAGIQEWGTDVDGDGSPYSNWNRKWFNLTTAAKTHSGVLIMSPGYEDPGAGLVFYLDYMLNSPVTLVIDNIRLTRIDTPAFSPPPAPEMIWNGDFSRDINFWWWWSANGTLVPDCSGGKFVLLNPDPGTPRGQMCIKSNKLDIISGNVYEIYVNASSTVAGDELELTLSERGVDIDGDGQNYSHLDSKTIQLTASDVDHGVTLSTIYSSMNICLNIYFTGTRGTIGINSVSMKPKP
jgi:hypothetical protein